MPHIRLMGQPTTTTPPMADTTSNASPRSHLKAPERRPHDLHARTLPPRQVHTFRRHWRPRQDRAPARHHVFPIPRPAPARSPSIPGSSRSSRDASTRSTRASLSARDAHRISMTSLGSTPTDNLSMTSARYASSDPGSDTIAGTRSTVAPSRSNGDGKVTYTVSRRRHRPASTRQQWKDGARLAIYLDPNPPVWGRAPRASVLWQGRNVIVFGGTRMARIAPRRGLTGRLRSRCAIL